MKETLSLATTWVNLEGRCSVEHNRVQLIAAPSTVAHQAPLSAGFLRQEYCSGLPVPTSGN